MGVRPVEFPGGGGRASRGVQVPRVRTWRRSARRRPVRDRSRRPFMYGWIETGHEATFFTNEVRNDTMDDHGSSHGRGSRFGLWTIK
jgi:hypothetical protein